VPPRPSSLRNENRRPTGARPLHVVHFPSVVVIVARRRAVCHDVCASSPSTAFIGVLSDRPRATPRCPRVDETQFTERLGRSGAGPATETFFPRSSRRPPGQRDERSGRVENVPRNTRSSSHFCTSAAPGRPTGDGVTRAVFRVAHAAFVVIAMIIIIIISVVASL